ncbi:metal ABC transporter ATP-binding protein [Alicyclobacillus dauci]|uniref:ABC transporter ATP-binding protein n=1 Tax=Alicyclobacillus dauci TaxID=1475485 RepID=A0ABY6YYS9_9BACL|nr:ABC transporter ATP-binding protein [Alicyclobacillus dauci]WAH35790.1 ABC transporter ATP-binding protein [Alicyclobacillus dauci]
MNEQSILQLKQLTVRFGDKTVLDNIDIEIKSGEFVGVIGQNGAGKTTLLRVILGLLKPNDGEVLVDGTVTRKMSRLIGYVPQKIHLDLDTPLRGRDLVGLGLDGHRWGVPLPSRARRDRIDEALAAVDAVHFGEAPVGKLSGGEQQRLLIAQALLTNPRILLLDEPLSNLDIRSAYEVVRLVSRLSREQGLAVMFVAHDMNPLLSAMDKVLYLANGRSAMGTVEEVIQTPVLSALYGYHVEVLRIQNRILVVGGTDESSEMMDFVEGAHCDRKEATHQDVVGG